VTQRLAIYIPGKAQPAGSKRAFPFAKGNGKLGVRVTDSNPKAKSWKGDIIVYARQAMLDQGWAPVDCAVCLTVVFHRVRPAGHTKADGSLSAQGKRTPYPISKPDCTKLVRGLEDALTEAGVWTDDARVVRQVVSKIWGVQEGTRIEVEVVF
jgi:Holliday junction resolvase RusA-like endonuclease